MTPEERKRIVDDAVAHVERVFAKARDRHDAHVFTYYDHQRGEYVARLMAEAAERDDDDTADDEHEDEDDGYSFAVDERREYGTLWAYNGSVVG
jgi:hypothetical protein